MENVRAVEDLFGATLHKLTADVSRESTVALVTSRIAAAFVVALHARNACVYLLDTERRELHLSAAHNIAAVDLARLRTLDLDGSLPASIAARLGLVQLAEAPHAPPCAQAGSDPPRHRTGGAAAFAIPLFANALTTGAISAEFDDLSLRDCASLALLSDSLGALVDGARLREHVAWLEARECKSIERLALVARELRQPVNMMVVAASFLRARCDSERTMLRSLHRAARLLDHAISNLADAALLESGAMRLRLAPTDVVALAEATVASNHPVARISVDGDIPRLDVDPQRFEQILDQLLLNALTHGTPRNIPEVDLARSGEDVLISVTNAGRSIPEDERARVFDPYYRSRDEGRNVPGLGLGLFICRKLVEAHGGRIWTDHESSRTRFCFSLPLRPLASTMASTFDSPSSVEAAVAAR